MKTATVTIKGLSPYSQSKYLLEKKKPDEGQDDFERRIWKDRLHVTDDGTVFIPPMAIKKAITSAASFLSVQIKGKGKKTYTKHFQSGVLITDPIPIDIAVDDIEPEELMLDGQPGKAKLGSGGTRVMRCYPKIPHGWIARVKVVIISPDITNAVFEQHIEAAGMFIGIGRFRPENGGFYGRFEVTNISWKDGI
jgi:hypothetical protein